MFLYVQIKLNVNEFYGTPRVKGLKTITAFRRNLLKFHMKFFV